MSIVAASLLSHITVSTTLHGVEALRIEINLTGRDIAETEAVSTQSKVLLLISILLVLICLVKIVPVKLVEAILVFISVIEVTMAKV